MAAMASWSADNGGPAAAAHATTAAAASVEDEDIVIADLFHRSQHTASTAQRQRHNQHSTLVQAQAQPHGTQHSHDKRHEPSPSVETVFADIAGPIRRVWLLSHRSSHSQRSKRRRLNTAMVDLTSDERMDEWQRAAEAIANRQPSWRTLLTQHCHLTVLNHDTLDSHTSAPLSSSVSAVLVRVDTLIPSFYSPSPTSSKQAQLNAATRRRLQAAGVPAVDSAGVDVLSGYHSACVSDGRSSVTADVQDSLCRSSTGSSVGGVLSVGCYVLLRDVAVLAESDGRPPHLVVQRYNVCAVQQPSQWEAHDTSTNSTALNEADSGATNTMLSTQCSVLSVSAAAPSASSAATRSSIVHSSIVAVACGETSEALDSLEWGDD